MGFSCSILGINVAHELGHRPEPSNAPPWHAFFIELATKEDPGTARRNEWLQVFWFRAVFVAWWSAWKIEAKNMRRKGLLVTTPSSAFKPCNGVCLRPSGSDWAGKSAWPGAGLFGGFLLEVVNYVEHYGLEATKSTSTATSSHHSWNSATPCPSHVASFRRPPAWSRGAAC